MKNNVDNELKCLECYIPCINLYRKSRDNEGGELFVLENIVRQREKEITLCQSGVYLQALCLLLHSVGRRKMGASSYLAIIMGECIRDLKASVFLSYCGHHRQAMQVLRAGFETWIHGVYYQTIYSIHKKQTNQENLKCLEAEFEKWIKGEGERGNKLTFLFGTAIVDYHEMRKYRKLYDKLSKYIHSLKETPIGKSIRNKCDDELWPCPASAHFDQKEFMVWYTDYQRVVNFMVRALLHFFPYIPKNKDGREGLAWIRFTYEIDSTIICSDFKQTIRKLPKIDLGEFGMD